MACCVTTGRHRLVTDADPHTRSIHRRPMPRADPDPGPPGRSTRVLSRDGRGHPCRAMAWVPVSSAVGATEDPNPRNRHGTTTARRPGGGHGGRHRSGRDVRPSAGTTTGTRNPTSDVSCRSATTWSPTGVRSTPIAPTLGSLRSPGNSWSRCGAPWWTQRTCRVVHDPRRAPDSSPSTPGGRFAGRRWWVVDRSAAARGRSDPMVDDRPVGGAPDRFRVRGPFGGGGESSTGPGDPSGRSSVGERGGRSGSGAPAGQWPPRR